MEQRIEGMAVNNEEQKNGLGVSLIEAGIGLVTEIGIGIIFSAATGQVLAGKDLKPIEKIAAKAASAIMGGVVASACDDYISKKVNNTVNVYRRITSFFKEIHDNPEGKE